MDGGDRTHLRDVSFSSYLSMVGENFSADLAPTPPPPVPPARGLQTPRRAKTSEELGVFEAQRYYNMGVAGYDQEELNISESKLGYQVMTNRRNKHNNLRATPSVSSEASSWNSQSVLMLKKKASSSNSNSSSSFFSGIGCYGRSCSDKDSVVIVRKPVRKSEVCQIDPKLIVFDGTKQSLPRFHHRPKDEPLVLRSPVSIASSSSISRRVVGIKDEDVPRVSLEVFGSNRPADDRDRVLLNLERKLSMLTWDAVPKSQSIKDEIESDASSDLFEIENISSQNEQRYRGCETSYEPSEASIEWSVVTASAADFSGNGVAETTTTTPRKGGGILGCKSYKAVRVVEPLPAPKSSYRPTLPAAAAAVVGLTSHHHLRHNQSQVQ